MANILYFGSLPDQLKRGAEETTIPEPITTVEQLLAWLRKRGDNWNQYLADDKAQVTINKKFAELDSTVSDSDEIAIISIGLR